MADDLEILKQLPKEYWPRYLADLDPKRKERVLEDLKGQRVARQYVDDPAGYITNVLHESIWSAQHEICEAIRDHERVAVPAAHAPGKMGHVDTPVLTPSGWKRLGDLVPGDATFAQDGSATIVTDVLPQGRQPIYRVHFNDQTWLDVGLDHLWVAHCRYQSDEKRRCPACAELFIAKSTERFCDNHRYAFGGGKYCSICLSYKPEAAFSKDAAKRDGLRTLCRECHGERRRHPPERSNDRDYWQVMTTRELIEYGGSTPIGHRRAEIPLVAPVLFPEQPVAMDPYILGICLGDGNHTTQLGRFTSIDSEIIAAVAECYPVTSLADGRGHIARGLHTDVLRAGVVPGPVDMVHVPSRFLWNSPAVRLAVLQGLMDSDGTVDVRSRTVEFSTCSAQLADDVVFLVQSFGGTATTTVKDEPTYIYKGCRLVGRPCYRVWVSMPLCPFRLARKAGRWEELTALRTKGRKRLVDHIERVEDADAVCIMVDHPSKTYVSKDFIVSHNSHLAARIIAWFIQTHALGTTMAITTATTFRQVRNILWPHLRRLHERHNLPGRVNLTEWWIGEELVSYGFCYDQKTEVLTDQGWKRFQELDGTELVATRSALGALEFQHPTAYIDEPYDGPMVRFQNQSLDALVTPNHNMLVERSPQKDIPKKGLQLLQAKNFVGQHIKLQPYRVPATSVWTGNDPGSFRIEGTDPNRGWTNSPWSGAQIKQLRSFYEENPPPIALPIQEMCAALNKSPRELTRKAQKLGISVGLAPRSKTRHVSPDLDISAEVWAAFLGLYLSEGWCGRPGSEKMDAITICQDPGSSHWGPIESVLAQTGLAWSQNRQAGSSNGFKAYHRNLANWLRQQCYVGSERRAWTKRVPASVFDWPPRLLNIFIDHLMMGDGHIERNGFRRYLTTSPQLADDLMDVAQRAGIEGCIRPLTPHPTSGGKRTQYRVSLRRDRHHLLPTGDVESYTGRIGCVTVPNGTLYVRRDGKAMWCGNSASDTDPESVQGIHAPHLLILVDEAAGISHALGGAFESLLSSGDVHIVLLGNPPTDKEGTWFEQCCKSERWFTVHLPASRTPNWTGEETEVCMSCPAGVPEHRIATHLVSKEWAQGIAEEWGEDSPMYQAKVLAQFPSGVATKVIPGAWVQAAMENLDPWAGTTVKLGCDIASDGGDEVAVARIVGHTAEITYANAGIANANAVDVAGVVLREILDAEELNEALGNQDPVLVKVDATGVGWGVVGQLQRWGEEGKHSSIIVPIKVGEKAADPDKYLNCLTEDARVQSIGDLRRIYRSRYDGPLYRIKMSSGDEFTATPNHNVLAPGGWVTVESLNVGDRLCNTTGRNRPTTDPDVDDMPPTIGEVYDFLSLTRRSQRVKASTVNFHGDSPTGEVDVINVDSELFAEWKSFRKQRFDATLVGALPTESSLQSQRRFERTSRKSRNAWGNIERGSQTWTRLTAHPTDRSSLLIQPVGVGDSPSSDSIILQEGFNGIPITVEFPTDRFQRLSLSVPFQNFFNRQSLEFVNSFRFNLLPWVDSVFGQNSPDHVAVHPVVVGQRMQGCPIQVPFDEVRSIEVVPPSPGGTVVYTLETSTGAYHGHSIAHRNCRAEMWWSGRLELAPLKDEKGHDLAPKWRLKARDASDRKSFTQLSQPNYRTETTGRIRIERKVEMKARGVSSPDRGEAILLAMYDGPKVRRRKARLIL